MILGQVSLFLTQANKKDSSRFTLKPFGESLVELEIKIMNLARYSFPTFSTFQCLILWTDVWGHGTLLENCGWKLPNVNELKYLRVLVRTLDKKKHEIDRWTGVASATNIIAQTSGRSLEENRCYFTLKGVSWSGSGVWSGWFLDAHLLRYSGHVQLGGEWVADPKHTWEIILSCLIWEHLGILQEEL